MSRSRLESHVDVLPEMVAALDLVRSALLAIEVVATESERASALVEEQRASVGGEARRPEAAAARATAHRLVAVAFQAQNELILSQLDVPPPVEGAAVLHGRVVDRGSGIASVRIVALDSHDRAVGETVTGELGEFILEIPTREQETLHLELRKGRSVLKTSKSSVKVDFGRVTFHELVVRRP
jgi:hypothetical protein